MSNRLRFGFVGAGGIFRARHLPALVRIPEVELVVVANRTRASAETVARDFGIPEVAAEWERVVARPDLDAVWIGTWPYMHRPLAIAALESGKHVFCQARMAMDLADARAMLEASRRRPDLVAMVCPAPSRLPYEPWFRALVAEERLGPISLVELVSRTGANLAVDRVNWRERVELSGKNALMLGIYAETLNAWFGPYRSLTARMATPVPAKRGDDGSAVSIRIPQVVAVAGELERGPLVVEHHTGLVSDTATREETITLWGLGGTVRHRFWTDALELAKPGGTFETVEVPSELRAEWTVERDFVEAVRAARAGRPWRVSPDFVDGAEYMRKVEAVHVSAEAGRAVVLAEL
jgi:predicted dehydrogenase